MTSAWAVVAAALGASALTGLFTSGLTVFSWRRDRRQAVSAARYEAYVALAHAAGGITLFAQTLGFTIPVRSGLVEGLNVTFGMRDPIEPLELGDRFERAAGPLMDASAQVWVHGTQRAIDAANTLVNLTAGFMSAAVQSDMSEKRAGARVATLVRGARRTEDQERVFNAALKDFMAARAGFLGVVRDEFGEGSVVFGFGEDA